MRYTPKSKDGYSSYKSPFYLMHQQWKTMIARCENTNRPEYSRYGGRGIKVCNSWHDFDKFKEWMVSSGYVINGIKRTQTIDRIDVNGDYCPDNCRLVNMKVQDNNKRNNIYMLSMGMKPTP